MFAQAKQASRRSNFQEEALSFGRRKKRGLIYYATTASGVTKLIDHTIGKER